MDTSSFTPVQGYRTDDSGAVDWEKLFASYATTGFQATNLGKAIEKIDEMLRWRLSDEPIEKETDDDWKDPELRARTKAKIFLGYTCVNLVCTLFFFSCFLKSSMRADPT